MQLETSFYGGLRSSERVSVLAEVPEPLVNAAGSVVLDGDNVRIEALVDDAARNAGIAQIERVEYPCMARGQQVLRVLTDQGPAYLALANRPDLQALVANQTAIHDAIQAARNAYWRAERDQAASPAISPDEE